MKFTHPDILFWLWAVIPIAWLLAWGVARRKKILIRFAAPDMYPFILPGFDPRPRWIKAGLIIVALVLALFALAGPTMGFRWEKTTARGVDIMIALDCSRSMLAQDIKPSRLERAKREIIDLLRLMKSDRAGLVAFSGQAILQCPLTLDHEAFHIFLQVLTPDYLPVGGTNLTAAIEAAQNGFEADADTDKAIILITDGENTAGDVSEIAQKMADSNIKVFCIGVGDPAGAPIPHPNGGFKKDDQGNIILSKVDEAGLKEIATTTRAAYVRSVAGDMDLDLIYTREIRGSMEQKTMEQGKKKVWEQRFQWFLFPCVLLLLIELWLPVTSRRRAAKLALAGLTVMVGLGAPAPADAFTNHSKEGVASYEAGDFQTSRKHFIDAQLDSPDDLRLYYNIGAAAYKTGAFEEAEKNFAHAAQSQDPELRQKALFNLANTQYRQGRLDDAIKGYESILESFPEDQKTKENLEFVKQKKKEQAQQQNQQCDNPQDKDTKDRDNEDRKGQDQKGQNQEKQGKQDKQDGADQEDNQQRQSREQDQQQQQQGQSQQDQAQQNQTQQQQPGLPPEPKPAKGEQPEETGEKPEPQQAVASQAQPEDPGEPGDKALENRLNRLEDKPGMALMPVGRPGTVEKDW